MALSFSDRAKIEGFLQLSFRENVEKKPDIYTVTVSREKGRPKRLNVNSTSGLDGSNVQKEKETFFF